MKLVRILKNGGVVDYDMIRVNCKTFSKEFWSDVFNIFYVENSLRELYYKHRDTLFTKAIKEYISVNFLNIGFISTLCNFKILTLP